METGGATTKNDFGGLFQYFPVILPVCAKSLVASGIRHQSTSQGIDNLSERPKPFTERSISRDHRPSPIVLQIFTATRRGTRYLNDYQLQVRYLDVLRFTQLLIIDSSHFPHQERDRLGQPVTFKMPSGYSSREDPGQMKKNKQSMADLKLRRLTELNTRLREDLERERIPVSQASRSIINYTNSTKDFMVPSVWGTVDKREDPYTPQREFMNIFLFLLQPTARAIERKLKISLLFAARFDSFLWTFLILSTESGGCCTVM